MSDLYRTLWGAQSPQPPTATKPIALTAEDRVTLVRLQASNREKARRRAGNPLVAKFGKGADGKTCGGCQHLIVKTWDKRYFKCRLRGDSNGSATDHRKKWPACGRFCGPEGERSEALLSRSEEGTDHGTSEAQSR
jgi:hypothetical protein